MEISNYINWENKIKLYNYLSILDNYNNNSHECIIKNWITLIVI